MTVSPHTRLSIVGKATILFWDLKFPNALFGLPLAYVGMLLASQGAPTWQQALWITLAVLGARTFGFAVNQLVDRELDARHPAKRTRALPAGHISVVEMGSVAAGAAGLFLLAASQLNLLALALAAPVLAYLVFYAYTKRFTWTTQLFMGPTTATTIAGGWVGVTGSIGWEPAYLMMSAFCWVAGFDILISTPDRASDVQLGLHSMARRWGVGSALWISRGFYAVAALFFLGIGPLFDLGPLFYPLWGAAATTLLVQQRLFDPDDFEGGHRILFRLSAPFSALLLLGVLLGQNV